MFVPLGVEQCHPVHCFAQRLDVQLPRGISGSVTGAIARFCFDAHAMELAGLDAHDHLRVFQHLEMARDRGGGDRKRFCQLGDGATGTRHAKKDLSPRRIGQRLEDPIQIFVITINHVVKCYRKRWRCQQSFNINVKCNLWDVFADRTS